MGGSADADPFDLQRFVDAQAVNHAQALDELIAGRKRRVRRRHGGRRA